MDEGIGTVLEFFRQLLIQRKQDINVRRAVIDKGLGIVAVSCQEVNGYQRQNSKGSHR